MRGAVLCLLWLVPLCAFGQGRVRPAGQLKVARSGHTATLLDDGRVLVVGGRGTDATVELSVVELFDPKTVKWSVAAPLSTGRAGHTATRLADGRVLVAGGTGHDASDGGNRYVALATAELYDPKTNQWKAASPMADARNWHTATVLDDGRVLVVGGAREARHHLAAAELYSPETDTWAKAPPLHQPRCLHQALPVPGGVLVLGGRSNQSAGGTGFGQPVATVERYTTATNSWSAAPELSEARQFHAAVVLPDGHALVVGGAATTILTNLAEWLGPGDAAWKQAERSLSLGHAHHTATVLPTGDVLVVGGESTEALDSTLAQRLDQRSERWCVAGALGASRKKHTATLLKNGKVLVVGGTSAGIPEPLTELWEAAAGPCVEPPGPTLGF